MIDLKLPLKTISESNTRGHWAKRAARVKGHRFATKLAVRPLVDGLRMPDGICRDITLTRVAPRKLDDDNLRGCLKAVRDGVADALDVDDGDERISWRYEQERGKPGEYAVRIRLEVAA